MAFSEQQADAWSDLFSPCNQFHADLSADHPDRTPLPGFSTIYEFLEWFSEKPEDQRLLLANRYRKGYQRVIEEEQQRIQAMLESGT